MEAGEGRRQKELILILAREFASKLATPMFVADRHGDLIFYNEPAEEVLGRTFAEAGEMPADRWTSLFSQRISRADRSVVGPPTYFRQAAAAHRSLGLLASRSRTD